ncbi:MAG: gamma-glutamylcyclotransferase family protein [Novosphingobium sp.]|nr:gamma-glutamylcyclotransferase family protein [Novosphingobium sp.]
MIRALFFYGVLLPGLVSGRMAELVGLLDAGVPATVRGSLYAVPDPRGHYPVLVADPAGPMVKGRLHRSGPDFGEAELAEMDAFEGFFPGDPARSDYLRRGLTATLPDGREVNCEAYVWNRAIAGSFVPIHDGDFASYLGVSGAGALPG